MWDVKKMEHIWTESRNIDVQRIVNIASVLCKVLRHRASVYVTQTKQRMKEVLVWKQKS